MIVTIDISGLFFICVRRILCGGRSGEVEGVR